MKEAREKEHIDNRITPTQITANCSSEIMEVRSKWHNTFQVLKEKTVNHEFYFQQNYSSGMKGKLMFSDEK